VELSNDDGHIDVPMLDIFTHVPDETDSTICWSSYNVKPPPINMAFLSHLAELPGQMFF
jgi:hypothetical protein